jgi:hypothetical protein
MNLEKIKQADALVQMKFDDFYQRLIQVCKSSEERVLLEAKKDELELSFRTSFFVNTTKDIMSEIEKSLFGKEK